MADINGDNKLDAVVHESPDGSIYEVHPGIGDGTFGVSPMLVAERGSKPVAVEANGDLVTDLLFVTNYGGLGLFLGNGEGTFGARGFPTANSPNELTTGDFNSDGNLDIAIVYTGAGGGGFDVLNGDGHGTFASPRRTQLPGTLTSITAISWNTDALTDLMITDASTHAVRVLLGQGDGTFVAGPSFATGAFPNRCRLVDINGDMERDLLVLNRLSGSVSVHLGTGGGTFGIKRDYPAGTTVEDFAISDLDLDGRPDLLVASSGTNSISILSNLGSGMFGPMNQYGVGVSPSLVATIDSDGQYGPDILAGGTSPGLALLISTGGGFLPNGLSLRGVFTVIDCAIADFDGDGNLDIVAGSSVPRASLLLGDGVGGFNHVYDLGYGGTGGQLHVADVNEDGRQDVIALGRSSSDVVVLLNRTMGNTGVAGQGAPTRIELTSVRRDAAELVLDASVPESGFVRLGLYDVSGRRIWGTRIHAQAGQHRFRIPADVPAGVYFAAISDQKQTASRKVALLQ